MKEGIEGRIGSTLQLKDIGRHWNIEEEERKECPEPEQLSLLAPMQVHSIGSMEIHSLFNLAALSFSFFPSSP